MTLQNRSGFLFDALALAGYVYAVPWITSIMGNVEEPSSIAGVLLLAAVLLQCLGASIKARFLPYRLFRVPGEPEPAFTWYALLFILLVMHWGLFATCMTLGLGTLINIASLPAYLGIPLVLGGGILPTAFTIRAMVPARPFDEICKSGGNLERLGDFLLVLSLMVLFALWDTMIVSPLAGRAQGNIFMSILLVVLTSVPFGIFYLAPRLLFIVEDYRQRDTWVQISLVALTLAVRLVT